MSLFDQMAGAFGHSTAQPGDGGNSLLPAVLQLLNSPNIGGIAGLMAAFHKGGIGEIFNSWVSTGQNLPVSAEQIQQVLGNETLQSFAGQLGLSPDQASTRLADILPQAIDKLTPNGNLPPEGSPVHLGPDLVNGLLKNLLSR